MIRSLPSSRIVPALLLCIVTFLILVRVLFPAWEINSLSAFDDTKCDADGHCEPDSLVKAPTRQEFVELQHTLEQLKSEVDKLKEVPHQKEPEKELTPDQKLWESRRTECGEGVLRNIDYLHVRFPLSYSFAMHRAVFFAARFNHVAVFGKILISRAFRMKSFGRQQAKNSGLKKPVNGVIMLLPSLHTQTSVSKAEEL